MNNQPPIYNRIGVGYNTTRRADPYIAERIIAQLQPESGKQYLDIGCGTGNYMHYLVQLGYSFCGIDPSETMLAIAREKCPDSSFLKAYAENIPLASNTMDGAIATFTLHHWNNQRQGLSELYRVLKPKSNLVFLSFTAEQMEGYWLMHYFPKMVRDSGETIPTPENMIALLKEVGFSTVTTEKYFVHEGLQDQFMYANKYNPSQYLNPEVRKGISAFAAFSTEEEVSQGLKQLEIDIASGKIQEIIKSYENDKGDYLFYTATK